MQTMTLRCRAGLVERRNRGALARSSSSIASLHVPRAGNVRPSWGTAANCGAANELDALECLNQDADFGAKSTWRPSSQMLSNPMAVRNRVKSVHPDTRWQRPGGGMQIVAKWAAVFLFVLAFVLGVGPIVIFQLAVEKHLPWQYMYAYYLPFFTFPAAVVTFILAVAFTILACRDPRGKTAQEPASGNDL